MYNQQDFVRRATGLSHAEVIAMAQSEAAEAERGTSGVKGAVRKRNAGALDYAEFLKGVIFFLSSGTRPGGLTHHQFMSLRPLVEDMVSRGIYHKNILAVFRSS